MTEFKHNDKGRWGEIDGTIVKPLGEGLYWFTSPNINFQIDNDGLPTPVGMPKIKVEVKEDYGTYVIDQAVLAWNKTSVDQKYPEAKTVGHFAGVNKNGYPMTWVDGKTSFTADEKTAWDFVQRYRSTKVLPESAVNFARAG